MDRPLHSIVELVVESPEPAEKLDALLNTIKNKINIQILLLLSMRPSYTREIAEVLQQDETSISRRLKHLEKLGLVRSHWKRVGGKNVKIYELNIEGFSVRFDGGALEVSFSKGETYRDVVRLRRNIIPEHQDPIGREEELYAIHSSNAPIIHVWGLPGVGKSSLVAWYVKRYRRNNPVYWYVPISSDTGETLKWKLSLLASTITGIDARSILNSGIETLARLLSRHSAVIVFDDFHDMNRESREYALSLTEKIENPARVFVVSRYREKKLPYWKGRVLDLEIKPLSPEATMELLEALARDIAVNLSKSDVARIVKSSGGIPLLVHGIVNLYKSTGLPLDECINRVVTSYYESEIGEILGENDKLILELLIAGGGTLPAETLCDILALKQITCSRRLNALKRLGFVEVLDEEVKVRERIAGLPKVASTHRLRFLARQVARALSRHPDIKRRMQGLLLMAENCFIDDVVPVIEKRLLYGSSWMTCCFGLYHSIVGKLQYCNGLTLYQRSLFTIEKTLIEVSTNKLGLKEGVETLQRHVERLRSKKPMYARIAALLAGMLVKTGKIEEGKELLDEAKSIYQELPRDLKKVIESTILGSDTVIAFYEGDLERALNNSIREAQIELEKEDFGNYAVALVHIAVIQSYMGEINGLKKTLAEIEEVASLLYGDLKEHIMALAAPIFVFASILEGDLRGARTRLAEAKENRFIGYVKEDIMWEEAVLDYLEGNLEPAREKARQILESRPEGIVDDELLLMRVILGQEPSEEEVARLSGGIMKLYRLLKSRG